MERIVEYIGITFALLDFLGLAEHIEQAVQWVENDLKPEGKHRLVTFAFALVVVVYGCILLYAVLHDATNSQKTEGVPAWESLLISVVIACLLMYFIVQVFVRFLIPVGVVGLVVTVKLLRLSPRGAVGTIGLLLALGPMVVRNFWPSE